MVRGGGGVGPCGGRPSVRTSDDHEPDGQAEPILATLLHSGDVQDDEAKPRLWKLTKGTFCNQIRLCQNEKDGQHGVQQRTNTGYNNTTVYHTPRRVDPSSPFGKLFQLFPYILMHCSSRSHGIVCKLEYLLRGTGHF